MNFGLDSSIRLIIRQPNNKTNVELNSENSRPDNVGTRDANGICNVLLWSWCVGCSKWDATNCEPLQPAEANRQMRFANLAGAHTNLLLATVFDAVAATVAVRVCVRLSALDAH